MAGHTSDSSELARLERTIQNSEPAYGHLCLRAQDSSSYRSDWFRTGGQIILLVLPGSLTVLV